jgi:sterol desaturase/sphingolipid hydroxylase (fatty acid hydroxylase superfamily)
MMAAGVNMQFFTNKAGVVLATLMALFILERVFPAVRVKESVSRLTRNFSLAGANFLIGPFVVLPLSQFAAAHAINLRPSWWNMALDLLVLDLWIYVWHRLNHVVPLLWRFHEVHHLDETLDTTTALRFHFGEVALSSVARAGVIWLVGVPIGTVVVFETLIIVAALFQHSNVKLPPGFERVLSYVIVTPSIHWLHHHALRADTDSSYSTILSVWDRIFLSISRHQRAPDMDMGLEGLHDQPLTRLILRPFTRQREN